MALQTLWGSTVQYEVSSSAPDGWPTWVDLSDYVRPERGDVDVQRGRQTELDTTEPSRLSLLLDNGDLRTKRFADITDAFTRVTVNDWGTAPTGQVWARAGGVAADYQTDGASALHILSTVNASRRSTLPVGLADTDIMVTVTIPIVSVGDSIDVGLMSRYVDGGNYYLLVWHGHDDGTWDVRIRTDIGTVFTTVVISPLGGLYAAGSRFVLRMQTVGRWVKGMVWPLGGVVPTQWQAMYEDVDNNCPYGDVGIRSNLQVGWTGPVPTTITWDDWSVTDPWQPAGRFTSGNIYAPTYPWWKPARRSRLRETIGGRTFDLISARIEIPQTNSYMQTADGTGPADLTAPITAVDELGRLQSARTFASTLTEYILFRAPASLVAYWPMNDDAQSFRSIVGQPLPTETTTLFLPWGTPSASDGVPQCIPASQPGPPGDDISVAAYEMEVQTVGGILRPGRSMGSVANIPTGVMTLAAGEVITFVAWLFSDWPADDSESFPLGLLYTDPSVGSIGLTRQDTAKDWLLEVTGPTALAASFVGPIAPAGRWTQIGIRFGFNPNVIELWTDTVQTVGTLTGAAPTSAEITEVLVPDERFAGAIAHAQVYIGASSDFTFADFQAQRAMALTGLDRQSTGQRINTILDYAGVPAGQRDIDPGVAVMQRALLAGRTPGTALTGAVETERGRLFVAGDGRITFHDRHRIYNI